MDPFSAEGELVNLHTAFVQGQYESVLTDFHTSNFSESNRLACQILQYRAQCALGGDRHYADVFNGISSTEAKSTPDLAAMKTYASYLQHPTDKTVSEAEQLAEAHGQDNLSVQLLCGIILARAGKEDAALILLQKHQGSLDAVALIVQIYLTQNRIDLAQQAAKSARSFAQDALLVNLAESWIGMRKGGEEYQKAFYVFEELAQAPSSASAMSLVAQAVSELHLGRVEEAETALNQALTIEPGNKDALANKVVLDTVTGKDASESRAKLEKVDKEHEILADLTAKREAFREACKKYSPKFEP